MLDARMKQNPILLAIGVFGVLCLILSLTVSAGSPVYVLLSTFCWTLRLCALALPAVFLAMGRGREYYPLISLSAQQRMPLLLLGALAVCPVSLLGEVMAGLARRLGAAASGSLASGVTMQNLWLISASSLLLSPVCEELFYRNFLPETMRRAQLPGRALVSSLLFAASHGVGPLFLPRAGFGLLLYFLRWRTGSLLAPLLVHVTFNLTVLLVSGLGLSGVLFGLSPVSGMLRLLGSLLFFVMLKRAWTARGYGMPARMDNGKPLTKAQKAVLIAAPLLLAVAQAVALLARVPVE